MESTHWAYAGYLLWLPAGCGDFACHRRARRAQISGWAESSLHLLQLALVGGGVLIWLCLQPGLTAITVWVLLVLVHAWVGYLDTRVAWRSRPITPLEQHLHSVLDLAPWIALALLLNAHAAGALELGWTLAPRTPPASPWSWLVVLLPALLLCVLPALTEAVAAWRARPLARTEQQA